MYFKFKAATRLFLSIIFFTFISIIHRLKTLTDNSFVLQICMSIPAPHWKTTPTYIYIPLPTPLNSVVE